MQDTAYSLECGAARPLNCKSRTDDRSCTCTMLTIVGQKETKHGRSISSAYARENDRRRRHRRRRRRSGSGSCRTTPALITLA